MRVFGLTIICMLISLVLFDGAVTQSSILYIVPIPPLGIMVLLLMIANIFALFAATILHSAGERARLVLMVSAICTVLVFLFLELIFDAKFALIDTKTVIMILPVILFLLSCISVILSHKSNNLWALNFFYGLISICGSILTGVILYVIFSQFGGARQLSSQQYHSIVFSELLLIATLPIILEYVMILKAWKFSSRIYVKFLLILSLIMNNMFLLMII